MKGLFSQPMLCQDFFPHRRWWPKPNLIEWWLKWTRRCLMVRTTSLKRWRKASLCYPSNHKGVGSAVKIRHLQVSRKMVHFRQIKIGEKTSKRWRERLLKHQGSKMEEVEQFWPHPTWSVPVLTMLKVGGMDNSLKRWIFLIVKMICKIPAMMLGKIPGHKPMVFKRTPQSRQDDVEGLGEWLLQSQGNLKLSKARV